ncbi:MAG TPA: hypothetical protein VKP03_00645 [Patescibacteria group bacterium]|nr:hypothetical protein [Patescibacteria group bacterium]
MAKTKIEALMDKLVQVFTRKVNKMDDLENEVQALLKRAQSRIDESDQRYQELYQKVKDILNAIVSFAQKNLISICFSLEDEVYTILASGHILKSGSDDRSYPSFSDFVREVTNAILDNDEAFSIADLEQALSRAIEEKTKL